MAIVGKIREKSTLLLVIVGLGLLLFIIPFDQIYGLFAGTGEEPIGEINGDEIYQSEYPEYSYRAQNIAASNPGASPEEVMRQEAGLFGQLMIDSLYSLELEKVGIETSDKEFRDVMVYGNGVPQDFKDAFVSEAAGQKLFDRDSLIKWYEFRQANVNNATGDQKAYETQQWDGFIQGYLNYRKRIKYDGLLSLSSVATKDEVLKSFKADNSKKFINYVYADYNTVDDSLVSVTEKEMKKYFEIHKNEQRFNQEYDAVGFDFISFPITASDYDKESAVKGLQSLKAGFKATSNDSVFIDSNSDIPVMAGMQVGFPVGGTTPYSPANSPYSEELKEAIANAENGEVVGPFFQTITIQGQGQTVDAQVIAKVKKAGKTNQDEVKQIIINTMGVTDTELAKTKSLADSLKNVLMTNSDQFAMLATQFTSNKAAFAQNNGVYYTNSGSYIDPEVAEFAEAAQVGEVSVVETPTTINVVLKTKDDIENQFVYIVSKLIKVSEQTRKSEYLTLGLGFLDSARIYGFEKAAERMDLDVQTVRKVDISNPVTNAFGYNENLMKWAFDDARKVGDLSADYTRYNQVIVVKLNKRISEGAPTFEGVKDEIEEELLKQKKIKYLAEKGKGASSVEQAGTMWSITATQTDTLSLSSTGIASVNDPIAVAKAMILKDGETKIIEGENGAYAVSAKSTIPAMIPGDMSTTSQLATEALQQYVQNNVRLALYRMGNVKDYRYKSRYHMDKLDR